MGTTGHMVFHHGHLAQRAREERTTLQIYLGVFIGYFCSRSRSVCLVSVKWPIQGGNHNSVEVLPRYKATRQPGNLDKPRILHSGDHFRQTRRAYRKFVLTYGQSGKPLGAQQRVLYAKASLGSTRGRPPFPICGDHPSHRFIASKATCQNHSR